MHSDTILKDFKTKYPEYTVIYLSLSGSKLYGTDGPNSDEDYKGIFIPPISEILLKTDIEHYTTTTGDNTSKNGADDLDVQLWSIYKFMNLLKKGETGALDLLFSMKRLDTVLVSTPQSNTLKNYTPTLLHKSVHSFIGYCVGQSKKYNIKGQRYTELVNFIEDLRSDEDFESINVDAYKYIMRVMAPGPKANKGQGDIPYISVLGKLFDVSLSKEYIVDKLVVMETQYGNRAKAATDSIDYKALSHAVRVLLEVEELLEDKTITFPLRSADYIKSVKAGNEELENVMNLIADKMQEVDVLMSNSNLPDKHNKEVYTNLLFEMIHYAT